MTDSRNSINLDDLVDFSMSNRISSNHNSAEFAGIYRNSGEFGGYR
jgi:hypothetical protein